MLRRQVHVLELESLAKHLKNIRRHTLRLPALLAIDENVSPEIHVLVLGVLDQAPITA